MRALKKKVEENDADHEDGTVGGSVVLPLEGAGFGVAHSTGLKKFSILKVIVTDDADLVVVKYNVPGNFGC
jgi:hypothetical protein